MPIILGMKWLSFFAVLVMACLWFLPSRISQPPNNRIPNAPNPWLTVSPGSLSSPSQPFHYSFGLRPVFAPDSNRIGFQNASGEWKIRPKYQDALPFSEGLAGVCLGDAESRYCGFIDTVGNWQIDPLFSGIHAGFQHGFAIVALPGMLESPYAFIDSSGGLCFPQVFAQALPFENGEAWVQCGPGTPQGRAYAWGLIDTQGHWKTPCEKTKPGAVLVGRFP